MRLKLSVSIILCASLCVPPVATLAASFSDVPESNPQFAAVEFLKARGILQGYSDGTFRPKQAVKRAEAVKILVASKLSADEIASFTKRSYTDVPEDAWYRPYVEAAFQKLGLIDGPPRATTFNGDRTIKRVEFLKLLFKSQGADTSAFSEIKLPLASDVTDGAAWYYPLMRYAIATSVLQVSTDGTLHPEAEVTRGELAELLYRFASYQSGKRTQALLSEEESELVNVLQMLDKKDFVQAEMASARALVAARGALLSKPTVPIVQAAVKIAESFRALVRAYNAGTNGKLDDVLTLSKEAWSLADRARQISPTLDELATRVQTVASNMANQARDLIKQSMSSSPK